MLSLIGKLDEVLSMSSVTREGEKGARVNERWKPR
jgi:hypothetical protein|tara:strand:+ start:29222 stop:29326 length:105 start_codon:yes stop_codon:yes gene_type:complete